MYDCKFLERLIIWIQFVNILLTRQTNNTVAQNKSFKYFFTSKLPSKNNPLLYIWTMLASAQCHSRDLTLWKDEKYEYLRRTDVFTKDTWAILPLLTSLLVNIAAPTSR